MVSVVFSFFVLGGSGGDDLLLYDVNISPVGRLVTLK